MYIKYNPKGDPFKIKNRLDKTGFFLKGLGLGIYWGEGDKKTKQAIGVANTDPFMLKSFIAFLKIICGVKQEKIHYSIVCFNDSNIREVAKYWSNQLKIRTEFFGKIVQIPTQGKGTYKKKSLYGVCTVRVHNIKLKQWLMDQIEEIYQPG